MTFLDLFAGIGGFRLGLEMAGHECKGHIEIDKYAHNSYVAMHKPKESEFYGTDIRAVEPSELPEVDIFTGGFPCQSFSIAGKRGGFEDTRGTLFFEIARLVKSRKPKIVLLENVRGLLSHDDGSTFETILRTLGELGYWVEYQVLNSKNFGVPQNRERVFIIGHLRDGSSGQVFPIRRTNGKVIEKSIDTEIADYRYDEGLRIRKDNISPCLTSGKKGGNGLSDSIYLCKLDKSSDDKNFASMKDATIRDIGTETAGTVTARYYKGLGSDGDNAVLVKEATKKGYTVAREGDSINLQFPDSETRRGRVGKGVAQTLETSCNQGVVIGSMQKNAGKSKEICTTLTSAMGKGGGHTPMYLNNYKIRRLTPKECFRLQGFPDEYFERAAKVNSDSQLYKQAGNSVTVNVIYEIAKRLEV